MGKIQETIEGENDITKAPKKKIILEFGSDEFLDAFHSVLRAIKEEKEAMEKRHNNLLEIFMQDIKCFKVEKKNNKSKK